MGFWEANSCHSLCRLGVFRRILPATWLFSPGAFLGPHNHRTCAELVSRLIQFSAHNTKQLVPISYSLFYRLASSLASSSNVSKGPTMPSLTIDVDPWLPMPAYTQAFAQLLFQTSTIHSFSPVLYHLHLSPSSYRLALKWLNWFKVKLAQVHKDTGSGQPTPPAVSNTIPGAIYLNKIWQHCRLQWFASS